MRRRQVTHFCYHYELQTVIASPGIVSVTFEASTVLSHKFPVLPTWIFEPLEGPGHKMYVCVGSERKVPPPLPLCVSPLLHASVNINLELFIYYLFSRSKVRPSNGATCYPSHWFHRTRVECFGIIKFRLHGNEGHTKINCYFKEK